MWGGKAEAFDLGYRWVGHSQASTRRLSNAALRAQGTAVPRSKWMFNWLLRSIRKVLRD